MKKILVINGNPKVTSLCHSLADSYVKGARESGYEINVVHLASLDFQPISRGGYDTIQELEPDLVSLQSQIQDASHLVFVFPVWWGSVPALLKGALDRVFLPNFAFKYQQGSPFPKQLLIGKTARLIVTMDTPPWYYRLIFGAPSHKMMKRTVLEFCGVKPVKITEFGPVISSNEKARLKWLDAARALGASGA